MSLLRTDNENDYCVSVGVDSSAEPKQLAATVHLDIQIVPRAILVVPLRNESRCTRC